MVEQKVNHNYVPPASVKVEQSNRIVKKWPDNYVTGAKRANLDKSDWIPDWFVGTGKDKSCYLEGTWWDMFCLARNILASENTKVACPEFYHPEYKIEHYIGGEPYEFKEDETNDA